MQPFEILEKEFGEWANVENVVACSSGTAALHLAFESLRLPKNSSVLVPDFAMVACARAVTMAGLVPVFVDCDDALNMSVEKLRYWAAAKANEYVSASAILAVHTYGRRCNMQEISKIAEDFNLFVVEDLAEAHGIVPHIATDVACWSFYKNKIIAGEEGGIVAFDSHYAAAETARELRSLGFTSNHDFFHTPRGHNYRMANLLAEPIRQSLKNYDENLRRRVQIEQWYDAACPDEWKMPLRDRPWVYDLRIKGLSDPLPIVRALNAKGIQARCGFKPLRFQPEYDDCRSGWSGIQVTNKAHLAAREVFYLPIEPSRTCRDDCKRAFEEIKSFMKVKT